MNTYFKNITHKLSGLFEKEPFFFVTLIVTVVLSFFSRPHISAVNWNVIATMFCLMTVVAAFTQCKLISSLAQAAINSFRTPRRLGFVMIIATGLLSMFVTNDVALLTVVPLTLTMAKISKKDPCILIILETLSANIFSAVTPFGNPQNLYLYSYFKIAPSEFFSFMVPVCLFGGLLVFICNILFNKGGSFAAEKTKFEVFNTPLLIGATVAFLLVILSVFRLLDYRIAFAATLLIFIILRPRLLLKPDFFLLATFVLFFLFTDSITGIPAVRTFFSGLLQKPDAVLFASAGLSQIISNVPAAVLLSCFTDNYRELLLGVTVGGLGTLVASLASLISYKLYMRQYKKSKYLLIYTIMNFTLLAILLVFAYLI